MSLAFTLGNKLWFFMMKQKQIDDKNVRCLAGMESRSQNANHKDHGLARDELLYNTIILNTIIYNFRINKSGKMIWLTIQVRIIEKFSILAHRFITRGVFRKDKVLFAFIVSMKVLLNNHFISRDEITFLLEGGEDSNNNESNNPAIEWLSKQKWNELQYLEENLVGFSGISTNFQKNTWLWRQFSNSPLDLNVPAPYNTILTPFQKIMLIRVLRPNMLYEAVKEFVTHYMLGIYASGRPVSWYQCYKEYTRNTVPLFIILQPGVDPLVKLRPLVRRVNKEEKLKIISVSQDRDAMVEEVIETAKEEGTWVCLLNCHLAPNLLRKIDKILDSLHESAHRKFRLVLTSFSSKRISRSILTRSMKIADEGPVGLKANLFATFNSRLVSNKRFYYSCKKKHLIFSRLLFGLAFFHSVAIQRKRFKSLGWNNPYKFNITDFEISVIQLQKMLHLYSGTPFNAIFYMIGECNYGGKLVEEYDRRGLYSVLIKYVNRAITLKRDHQLYKLSEKNSNYPQINLHKRGFTHNYYLSLIWAMPYLYPPELLGLHDNAEINEDVELSKEFISKMKAVQTTSTEYDMYKLVLSRAEDILGKLPKRFSMRKMISEMGSDRKDDPTDRIIIQEMHRYNTLIDIIKSSLSKLKTGIYGDNILPFEENLLCESIANNILPEVWKKAAYQTLKSLSAFITDLLERLSFITEWFIYGKPTSYWISGFFHPQSLIGAVMQDYGRKREISLISVALNHVIMDEMFIAEEPKYGVYIYGLYIEGARWNKVLNILDEQKPGVVREKMPVIWLQPIESWKVDRQDKFLCPTYLTRNRSWEITHTGRINNYLFGVFLNSNETALHWAERGVALICQPDDE